MAQDTVRAAAAVDTWDSFVKASLGSLGLALLAVGPLVPRDTGFHYLPQYTFVIGGLLVLVSATMRLRAMLIVVGCIALTAGLACTLVGGGDPQLNLAALVLYCGAAVVLGSAGRHLWMAVPFMLIPLLIVAPQGGTGWAQSREGFSMAWEVAVGGPFLLAGLPAALAVVGAVIGQLGVVKWVPVRPSAIPLLLLAGGLVLAGLVLASLLPVYPTVQTVCMRVAIIAAVLGWIALAYQVGRLAFVWEAALACLLYLAGALFLDRATQFPDAFGPTLGITIAASLVPAVLAGVGLLARKWMGTERPVTAPATVQLKKWDEAEKKSFFTAATTAPYVQPGPPQTKAEREKETPPDPDATPAEPTTPDEAPPTEPPQQPAP
ncbi:MAG: hypothetical protein QOJ26_1625 [Thermoplasmata archaeon]|nr:hypothetical protein [Thermoplasmata archaeon]